jgi:hypothetical protein
MGPGLTEALRGAKWKVSGGDRGTRVEALTGHNRGTTHTSSGMLGAP